MLDAAALDSFAQESLDPAVIMQVAHETAAIVVRTGRARRDPELTARLVALVDEVGLTTVAELWSERPARSLPGALWRLYVLREWVRRDAVGASADYRDGLIFAQVSGAIAGVATPPGPEEVRQLADSVLTGVFEGDLDGALDRAAAFCRVIAAGRASRDDIRPIESLAVRGLASGAAQIATMADDLEVCASLWRRESLV
ncbi:hypothetical protein [Mobilicoccus caccae]|uniref:DNA-directed RNA polymerase subunit beta n=1 Tax=Mobilicoccus caccae TaxID=1859295 RepID=A0ABQ6IWD6_9MICO|nr:hypothetical protein [Mobilicoccus caccae]GMA41009.1 hypothetical protein GCM10025883_30540 [Mobilicoccus caccae]